MKNRRKRAQREEVRKILHTMRLELAAQRLAQDKGAENSSLRLKELLQKANQSVAG